MSETTEKARALLAAVTELPPKPDGHRTLAKLEWMTCHYQPHLQAQNALFAAAPTLIATLCDELDVSEAERTRQFMLTTVADIRAAAAERRSVKSEARADRLYQDRHDMLGVKTTEGLSASEWMMRTATAERERDALRDELDTARNTQAAEDAATDHEMSALRAENAELTANVRRLEGRNVSVCECVTNDDGGAPCVNGRCIDCHGSGAVIVEGES